MPIQLMDSAASNDGASRWFGWEINSINANIPSPSGRINYNLSTSGFQRLHHFYDPAVASALVGLYAYNPGGDGSAASHRFIAFEGPTEIVHLTVTTDLDQGRVKVRRGMGDGTLLAESSPGVIGSNQWHHYEVRATVDDTAGRVEIWIDGIKRIDFTGNTRASGSDTTVGYVRIGRAGISYRASDVRVGDGTTPLGVGMVWHMLPTANGSNIDLTPEPTADNYTRVNEATPNGDTTYVHSDTEGDYDLYEYADLPSGDWDVIAVQTVINARVPSGGPKYIRPVVRSGISEAQGETRLLTPSYKSHVEVFHDNPVTTDPWTATEVDAIEFGPEIRDSD